MYDRYVEDYPNHCTSCEGTGIVYAEYQQIFDCLCVEEGKCPRCGRFMYWEGDPLTGNVELYNLIIQAGIEKQLPCDQCGWNWCRGNNDMLPIPDCICGGEYEP
jgi:hypothetical protein